MDAAKRLVAQTCADRVGVTSDDTSELTVSVVSGGITNLLLRVKGPSGSAVVRIFGEKTEEIVDRVRELQTSCFLAFHGFGKKIFGTFENGRVEEWLKGRSLTPDELALPDISGKIAAKTAELHKLQIPVELAKHCFDGTELQPTLLKTVPDWYSKCLQLDFSDVPEKAAKFATVDLKQLGSDIESMLNFVVNKKSPVVFAHNDLLSGNIMIHEQTGSINFIDFEYGLPNYRAFDIANHFCECCGFECDWSKYPDKNAQFLFFKSYLAEYHNKPQDQVTQVEIESLYEEVNGVDMAPHMFWALWAFTQARNSPIDFDFMSYGLKRLEGFYLAKARVLG
eukprot:GILJ01004456.1.p1 GENE.GILJ01004456.1~~GILJ01004456.1.p1  ORF type:complete len:371 (+),score=71.02 GILJ01004456.1:102-1115(+)